jgi:hypothetical protein
MHFQRQYIGIVLLLAVWVLLVAACQLNGTPPQPTATPWVKIITATFTPTVPPTEGPSPTPSPTPLPPTATQPPPTPPTFTPPPIPQPPVAQIIAPANGTQYFVGQVVHVQFTAGSQSGVSRVALYVGGTRVSYRDYAYRPTVIRNDTLSWTASAAGNHTIRIVAYDPLNNPSNPDQRSIVVKQQVAAPTVRIDYPTQRVVIQAHQHIQIQATIDGSVGIQRLELVERKDNQEVVYTSDTNYHNVPYQWRVSWQSPKVGDHRLFIRAWDTNNRTGQSNDFIIGVTDNNPPQVQASYSTTSLNQGSDLKAHVEAVDSKGVRRIALRVNDKAVDSWVAPDPAVGKNHVSVDLWWRNVGPPGTYDVRVRALDTAGMRTDSPKQSIKVKTGQPTPVPANVEGKWEGSQFRLRITKQRSSGKLEGTLRVENYKREALRSSMIQDRNVTIHAKVHDVEYNFVLTLSDDGQRLVGHWSTTQTGLLVPITFNKVQKFS